MPDSARQSEVHVVFGASGGIGSALCRRLAARGARLVLAARDETRLDAAAAEVGGVARPVDARDPEAVARVLKEAAAEFGRVDGVANLVGSIVLKPAHRTSLSEFDEVLDVNLRTAFSVVRAAVPVMRRTGGSVVLMSSSAARVGLPNHEAIAAAKAGVEGLVRSAAASYAGRGIRVNAVAPGLVRTPLSAHLTASPAVEAASAALHPLGRIGEPADVAAVLDWLLGVESGWVTGQVFGVDGGLSSVRPPQRA